MQINEKNMNQIALHSEADLVKGCIENNRAIQRILYNKYKDAMYTICFRMLGNYDDACDALQEGFIDVYNSIKNFRAESTLGAWIKTIIVRKCLKKLKKQIYFDDIDEAEKKEAISWDDELTGEILEKAILSLSPGYRNIFLMIEVEGYTHKETANILNISEGTSKSQLFHAKKLLQQKLRGLN